MPLWLIKFLPEIATAIAVGFLAYLLHCGSMNDLRLDHIKDLSQQSLKQAAECQKSKDITKELENALQSQIRTLRAKSSQPKFVCDNRPIPVQSTDAAKRNDGGTGAGQPVRPDGVPAKSLYGLADEGEQYRLRLITCQNWVKSVQEFMRGQ